MAVGNGVLFYVFSYSGEVFLHLLGVFMLDNVEKVRELFLYSPYLIGGVGVEQNLGQQEVVLR